VSHSSLNVKPVVTADTTICVFVLFSQLQGTVVTCVNDANNETVRNTLDTRERLCRPRVMFERIRVESCKGTLSDDWAR